MNQCPCGTNKEYLKCCGRYIEAGKIATTPEALMRSRYCAYVQANMDYIAATMCGRATQGFNKIAALSWAKRVKWQRLEIIDAPLITANAVTGTVEFIAYYQEDSFSRQLHELSEFRLINGRWFYVGEKAIVARKKISKLGRNDVCRCGSGKKYKRCCYRS